MENNEVMNEVVETEEVTNTEEMEMYEASTDSSVGTVVKILAGAAIAAGGILLYKSRSKLDNWQIKRLEKKGYVVSLPECEVEVESEDVADEESEDID